MTGMGSAYTPNGNEPRTLRRETKTLCLRGLQEKTLQNWGCVLSSEKFLKIMLSRVGKDPLITLKTLFKFIFYIV